MSKLSMLEERICGADETKEDKMWADAYEEKKYPRREDLREDLGSFERADELGRELRDNPFE